MKTITFAFVAIFLMGCYNDKEELFYNPNQPDICDTIHASFSRDILPIMQTQCSVSGCHRLSDAAGNVVLEDYSQISAFGPLIYQECVDSRDMPIGSSLTGEQINLLKCWINSGVPNN